MELTNEILFNPVGFFNYNSIDAPLGSDQPTYRANDTCCSGRFAYTRAVFPRGPSPA